MIGVYIMGFIRWPRVDIEYYPIPARKSEFHMSTKGHHSFITFSDYKILRNRDTYIKTFRLV